jgi:hypothetical protein
MIEKLLHTDPDYACTFLRIIAGLIAPSTTFDLGEPH